ncbi:hypothetical protein CEXT_639321 [Caerostris extrusa]|uniref:Maturase K n=1 Tax=Caerostris extrusa TaxID=172846 RepID=A0AAV4X3W2_CAEEX|nr:hypothetical protein CEXT_639321 [Caerostris extrusa]
MHWFYKAEFNQNLFSNFSHKAKVDIQQLYPSNLVASSSSSNIHDILQQIKLYSLVLLQNLTKPSNHQPHKAKVDIQQLYLSSLIASSSNSNLHDILQQIKLYSFVP